MRIRVDELVVGGNIVRDTKDKVNAIKEFWEEIGGVNEAESRTEIRKFKSAEEDSERVPLQRLHPNTGDTVNALILRKCPLVVYCGWLTGWLVLSYVKLTTGLNKRQETSLFVVQPSRVQDITNYCELHWAILMNISGT
ncbi:hypothetical protein Pmani_030717 [Petrolisthes manimaculis]|uniref:Uncharacterized protein n=1 Tax=Petrolisthes manimaculis TaxID=1843537 RepID=A0AAE1TVM6_9EUCA|nr:hypothetical protein Pmani_030717 [Petrolisthes manimaculis]